MNFFEYVDKGGIIVYILIFLNIVGFTIIIWKFLVLFKKNLLILQIKENLDRTKPLEAQIEYETKKLESGLTVIKNIAIISPLLGLLGTVVGIYILFDQITLKGLGDPTIFSGGIAIALITTVAGIIVSIPHQIAYNHFISAIDTIEVKAKKELVGHI
ncbi:MotA/TolQ/ExbB proton channel family protein [Aliarcobacter butzleri]|uniref:MotA/TolQ/ExbB proton channel family protein n=1 Tax=Aliarcobacter butzleri TaxID=28197 RepID=UPI001EDE8071|nr:MotA/TolQ/ExbB proton channel family protein [Aliarcobacter butzleri]MCG3696142.1 MotA/TolQ/ExbB proton channel family protein [Aliarcobacter butzleri]MCG3698260.1 MotA/TolQ/ExbB proton channel family protein [Aliarcobacter butzleri]MCT7597545.1 MotA/TolQ/ExbB proton channel family protein [Aliarcobacter butzleri]MDN5079213.1 MotA/TolQ/ExbB proton channel family protein [Aliarcobacter butzleri]MDN5090479.1 MotA/TolQ/ExbB proton channel family protein [Aliarcobacter butzleri]